MGAGTRYHLSNVLENAHIERKRYSGTRAERVLVDALRGRKGALTRSDAVALTGLPANETEEALKSLLGTYRSHLAVTDAGELIYSFDPAMVRRDRVPLRERLAAVGASLWRAFTFLFKIWIVVTLVAYVVAFVAMLVALVFARSSSDRDDRRRDDGFGFPWILWWMMPDWAPPEVRRRSVAAGPRKRFYRAVFDFVFGPPAPERDALADEREVVAYLRAMDGRVTATDLVAISGWSLERAEEEATRLLADYDGEPEVTDQGTIVYAFPELRRTVGASDGVRWRYAWQVQRGVAPQTGNPTGTDAIVGIMNGFNLFAALVIGPAFLVKYGIAAAWAPIAVTWFPLAFSALFFAIPIGRWIGRRREARRVEAGRVRAALIGEVVARRGVAATPEELTERGAERAVVEEALARTELERLLVDLDGDAAADEEGKLRYSFPRVAEELAEAQRARTLASVEERKPGEVVFSSEEGPSLPPSRLN
jgi:hypothetical protein